MKDKTITNEITRISYYVAQACRLNFGYAKIDIGRHFAFRYGFLKSCYTIRERLVISNDSLQKAKA